MSVEGRATSWCVVRVKVRLVRCRVLPAALDTQVFSSCSLTVALGQALSRLVLPGSSVCISLCSSYRRAYQAVGAPWGSGACGLVPTADT